MTDTLVILEKAKAVSLNKPLSTQFKNNALEKMAECLMESTEEILTANQKDIKNAEGKIAPVMIDRLRLDAERIKSMASGILSVAALPDPVGKVLDKTKHKNGLLIEKRSIPFGVVAIIYESRPNVTSDAAALSFKSGNVAVLRSGKDAYFSARAIVTALKKALRECNIDENYINLIEDTTRESANTLMTAVGLVDLLIPRGGKGLIKSCTENAKVPCIETGTGICHIYVDEFADIEKALKIVDNAKRSRPSVCNAAECLLVHKSIAEEFLPKIYDLFGNTEPKTEILSEGEDIYDTEFLDFKIALKIVDGVEEALKHITEHSTHHSESIITESKENADYFVSMIDSAAVYVNASTRFTDGGEFGLGCEMGISTQKLHARGPMGLKELNTYKYVIIGDGQIR
ncbi:MAG: glutamate-5-semialdehyde dehydrogenase [Clostridia bacterium]|nr:glutamate-5-semialdehyde dehydrogenase [Clostridia bacterium]